MKKVIMVETAPNKFVPTLVDCVNEAPVVVEKPKAKKKAGRPKKVKEVEATEE